jgi:ribosome biogenesis protein BRX1
MEELHFTGNCLKGSRPILSFDASFDKDPYLQVIRELFLHSFGVPQGARKSKPFIDHVMGFTYLDGKIWVRNYQVNEVEATAAEDGAGAADKAAPKKAAYGSRDTDIGLVEIGPRFVLTPIIIQEGSFGGPLIYENKQFVSPNQVRSDLRKQKMLKHSTRAETVSERVTKRKNLGLRADGAPLPKDDLDNKTLFA